MYQQLFLTHLKHFDPEGFLALKIFKAVTFPAENLKNLQICRKIFIAALNKLSLAN